MVELYHSLDHWTWEDLEFPSLEDFLCWILLFLFALLVLFDNLEQGQIDLMLIFSQLALGGGISESMLVFLLKLLVLCGQERYLLLQC